eukprot:scaffold1201_cov125-Isochrysis_galbana.AAC.4
MASWGRCSTHEMRTTCCTIATCSFAIELRPCRGAPWLRTRRRARQQSRRPGRKPPPLRCGGPWLARRAIASR